MLPRVVSHRPTSGRPRRGLADYNSPRSLRMRILMIAPQPFFQPRGTPFSEFYRARAMTELGHEVDMITYPIGEDVNMPGLNIIPNLADSRDPLDPHRAFASQIGSRRPRSRRIDSTARGTPLRSPGLPRGGGAHGSSPLPALRRSPPLRHAFVPSRAALELQVQRIAALDASVRPRRADHHSAAPTPSS